MAYKLDAKRETDRVGRAEQSVESCVLICQFKKPINLTAAHFHPLGHGALGQSLLFHLDGKVIDDQIFD
jgi:hypothetical protein